MHIGDVFGWGANAKVILENKFKNIADFIIVYFSREKNGNRARIFFIGYGKKWKDKTRLYLDSDTKILGNDGKHFLKTSLLLKEFTLTARNVLKYCFRKTPEK